MNHDSLFHTYDNNTFCIEAGYMRPGLASFYLAGGDNEYAVIETGTSKSLDRLLRVIQILGIQEAQIRYIVPTHVHLDHAGGAGAMMAAFPNAQLLIHPKGARHMIDPSRLIASSVEVYGQEEFDTHYGEVVPVPEHRVISVEDGQSFDIGSRSLHFRHTPGHAEHHFCIWDEMNNAWFTGDTYGVSYQWLRFGGGDFLIPAATPTQFDPDSYLQSLELLRSYRPQRLYLTHFGELRFRQATHQLLIDQLQAYCEIAHRCGPDITLIADALKKYTLTLIDTLELQTGDVDFEDRLDFDFHLNSQGLCSWLMRIARTKTK